MLSVGLYVYGSSLTPLLASPLLHTEGSAGNLAYTVAGGWALQLPTCLAPYIVKLPRLDASKLSTPRRHLMVNAGPAVCH